MELLYTPYVPNKAEFLILCNRNILADQMDFLAQHVSAHSRLTAPHPLRGPPPAMTYSLNHRSRQTIVRTSLPPA
jgi:hypothetical protein